MEVTYNRVKDNRFPSSFCDVIRQRYAFSWTIDKDLSPLPYLWLYDIYKTYGKDKIEMDSLNKIYREVSHFYFNKNIMDDITEGSVCYMSYLEYVSRDFTPNCPYTLFYKRQGNHVFFNNYR